MGFRKRSEVSSIKEDTITFINNLKMLSGDNKDDHLYDGVSK
jgi:hypothetical protein